MIKIKLKNIMDIHNVSISELSELTGLARSTITPLVNKPEEVKGIKIETLNVLCDFFGASIEEIIEFIPETKKYVITNLIKSEEDQKLFYILLRKNIGNAERYVVLSAYIESEAYGEFGPDSLYSVTLFATDSDNDKLPNEIYDIVKNKKNILPTSVYARDLMKQNTTIRKKTSLVIVKFLIESGAFIDSVFPQGIIIRLHDLPIYDPDKEHYVEVSETGVKIK